MNILPPTNPDPHKPKAETPAVTEGPEQSQGSCLVGWEEVTDLPDSGAAGPASPAEGAGGPGQPSATDTLDQLVASRLQEVDPSWTTGQVEAFIATFFRQLADRHASEVAVNEVIKDLQRTLKVQRGTAPTLPKLRKMYDMSAAAPRLNAQAPTKSDGDDTCKVHDCIADAPVGPDVRVPTGWDLSSHGVMRRLGSEEKEVLPAPLAIAGRLTNIADGTEALRLVWRRDGHWREHNVDRVVAADSRKVIGLAAVGVPVTSNNAADVVQYLADFEATNLPYLPQDRVSSQLGWAEDMTAFLWGRTLIQAETSFDGDVKEEQPIGVEPTDARVQAGVPFAVPSAAAALTPSGAGVGKEGKILFRAADSGDDQLADGFHAAGSFPRWRTAVLPALAYPRVRLAVAASLSAPVLAILDLANFGVDFCGETSKGKTTTLRVAASAWGRPDEKSPTAAISGWNSTRVWRERASTVLNNLPVILDETKLVRDKSQIGEFLYEMANGRGRGRGSLAGTQRTGTWHTVLLSSGEAPATSYSQDGGTKARVLTLWGSPFEKADEPTALLVKQLHADILGNYGHAGPRWVRFLLRSRDKWPLWRRWYTSIQTLYLKKAGNNPVVGRLADAFAVLTLTATLAGQALAIPLLGRNAITPLWADLTAEAADADRATEALRYVVDWAYSHQEEFWMQRDLAKGQPAAGWAGHWQPDRDPLGQHGPWDFIGFVPHKLREVMEHGSFDCEAVIRSWRDRGWLRLDKSDPRQRYHQAMVGDGKRKLICIARKAVEALDGPSSGPPEANDPAWLAGAMRQLENKTGSLARTDAQRQVLRHAVRSAVAASWQGQAVRTGEPGPESPEGTADEHSPAEPAREGNEAVGEFVDEGMEEKQGTGESNSSA